MTVRSQEGFSAPAPDAHVQLGSNSPTSSDSSICLYQCPVKNQQFGLNSKSSDCLICLYQSPARNQQFGLDSNLLKTFSLYCTPAFDGSTADLLSEARTDLYGLGTRHSADGSSRCLDADTTRPGPCTPPGAHSSSAQADCTHSSTPDQKETRSDCALTRENKRAVKIHG
ncbi:hypothetical protein PoB_006263900 [Plakobranchus ocellatus]|uniref:Uncharacterized protein n=1 Tax=Plakobranchus ocellatus TaxID=259542 RepID=A0AAV4CW65_9GAST|nr:hypothetical protein PoB_006263900 [Plakobranchus ocellatus]